MAKTRTKTPTKTPLKTPIRTTIKTPTKVNEGFQQALFHSLQLDTLRAIRYAQNPRGSGLKIARGSMEEVVVNVLSKRSSRARYNLVRKVKGELDRNSSMQQFMLKYQPSIDAKEDVIRQVITPMGLKMQKSAATPDRGKDESSGDSKLGFDYDVFDFMPSIQWQLLSVYCKDETNGFLGTEWGKDEIHMGGFGLDPLGHVKSWNKRLPTSKWQDIKSFKVGDFDDSVSSTHPNRRKVYNPPLRLIEFPLFRKFPFHCTNSFQLVEDDDAGSITKYFEQIAAKAVEKVEEAVGEELFGENAENVSENLIWKAIWDAITDFFKWIAGQLVDNDEFPAVVTSITLQDEASLQAAGQASYELAVQFSNKEITLEEMWDRNTATWAPLQGNPITETIKAHGGTYEVTYQWRIYVRQGLG
jgi:hypothetical protein